MDHGGRHHEGPFGHWDQSNAVFAFWQEILELGVTFTPKRRLKALAPGLSPKAALEKLATIQMIDVELPTTDGRVIPNRKTIRCFCGNA